MSQKTHLVVVLILGLAAIVFLATRPKFVVETNLKSENTSVQNSEDTHVSKISVDLQNKIDKEKKNLKTGSEVFVWGKIGDLFFKASVFDSSAYYFNKIAKKEPTATNYQKVGDTYLQAYNLSIDPQKINSFSQKAQQAYQKVLEIDSNNLQAETSLAMTYVKSASPMQAITRLRAVLERKPQFTPAILNLGVLSMQSGQIDKAIDRFNEVLEIDPNNPNARIGLAYSYIELEKTEAARTILNQLLKEDINPVLRIELSKTLKKLK